MKSEKWLLPITLFIGIVWLVFNHFKMDVPPDTGDGILHFFIAQVSWEKPIYFLHHWGKPLYTLLSSPFAQFSFFGLIVFNLLVYSLTVLAGDKLLRHWKTPSILRILLPFFLLLTNEYADTLLSALTEPVFSCVLLWATWFWVKKNYTLFAFLIGSLLFLRSEGQLPFLIALPLLLYFKQWKSTLFLFVPFLLYGLVGYWALSDFWWYFNDSPYHLNNDIYGHGTIWHYVDSYKNYLGNHGLFLFLASLWVLYRQLKMRNFNELEIPVLLLTYGTFFGILASHSYFWANGLNGSFGLTRITTQAMPSLLVCSLFLLGKVSFFQRVSLKFALRFIPILGIVLFLKDASAESLTEMEKAYLTTANKMQESPELTNGVIHSKNPLLCLLMGGNYLSDKGNYHDFACPNSTACFTGIQEGEFVIWDSFMGPLEMRIPYDLIQNDSSMMAIDKTAISGVHDYNGVVVYQKVPKEYKAQHPEKQLFKIIQPAFSIDKTEDEFVDVHRFASSELPRTIQVKLKGSQGLKLICAGKENGSYESYDLDGNEQRFQFLLKSSSSYLIYFWNATLTPFDCQAIELTEMKAILPKPYKGHLR